MLRMRKEGKERGGEEEDMIPERKGIIAKSRDGKNKGGGLIEGWNEKGG